MDFIEELLFIFLILFFLFNFSNSVNLLGFSDNASFSDLIPNELYLSFNIS